jgi:signal transduction histidine kinase
MSEGIGVGALTGLVGVGGGFAIVPALVLLAKIPMKQAIGTSLLVIFLNSVAGFLGYFGRVALDWQLMVSFMVAASLGIAAGAYLVRFVRAKHLQKAFGYHDLEGYAIAATKNQVFEAILIMMLRSLQAISRAFFMINLPSRVFKHYVEKYSQTHAR